MLARAFIFIVFAIVSVSRASDRTESDQKALSQHEAPSHYCGIYCVYGAARALNHEFAFDRLVQDRYLSSKDGSTASDLTQALGDIGLKGSFQGFLPLERLRSLNGPAILHVRSGSGAIAYRHWILFLGFRDNFAMIYDPPHDTGDLSEAELLSMWDGAAILISAPAERDPVNTPLNWAFAQLSLATMLALWGAAACLPRWAVIPIVALLITVSTQFFSDTGFWHSRKAVQNVEFRFAAPVYPTIVEQHEALRLIKGGKGVFVDARPSEAFQTLHIPGAINIPINSSYLRLRREVETLNHSNLVAIVYCNNKYCGWADQVATDVCRLRDDRSVVIYRGGLMDWLNDTPQND